MLDKRNHKGLTVETNNMFLNKSTTIAAEDRGINGIFDPTVAEVSYEWNSVPINGTDTLWSTLFTIDINIHVFPKITQKNSQIILNYLKRTNSSYHFSSTILKVLIEDHVDLVNNNRSLVNLKLGNIVITQTTI